MPDRLFRLIFASAALLAAPLVAKAQITRGPLQPPPGPQVLPATAADPYGYGAAAMGVPGAGMGMGMDRSAVIDPNRKLQPGDQLSFKIEQDRDPAIRLIVAHTGDVVIEPLEHSVHVAGLTQQQAQDQIKRLLEKDYYYTATVRLNVETAAVQVGYAYFSGAVARGGQLPITADRPVKLSQGCTMMGFGRYADDRRVKVTRSAPSGVQVFTVDVKSIIKEGHLEKDIDLKDGDQVFVPETTFKP